MQTGILKAIGAVGAAEVIGKTKGALANNIIDEAADRAKAVADLLGKIEDLLAEEEDN